MTPRTNLSGSIFEPEPVLCTCLACNVCGKPFETYVLSAAGRDIAPVKTCGTCTLSANAKEQEALRESMLASRRARFDELCPPTYRTEGIRAAMMEKTETQTRAIREHVQAGRGVIAIGDSGKFKTTAIFNGAVRWLVLEGAKVEYLTAAKFRQRASLAAKDCAGEAFVRSLARVPWLFLDDFGNMSTTPAASETLLDVLEMRMASGNRPVLATSQFGGEALIAKFQTREIGEAIVRRLGMLTTPVLF